MSSSIDKKQKKFQIIRKLEMYLRNHPEIRFGQALVNLNILEYKGKGSKNGQIYEIRDLYYDTDTQILNRIKNE